MLKSDTATMRILVISGFGAKVNQILSHLVCANNILGSNITNRIILSEFWGQM